MVKRCRMTFSTKNADRSKIYYFNKTERIIKKFKFTSISFYSGISNKLKLKENVKMT